jgi:hypothetical protein
MLESIGEDIWTCFMPMRLFGLAFNSRMTIIRLKNGRLWVHSPIKKTENLLTEIKALGDIQYLIAPNLLHHLFIGDWKSEFPNAEILAPKGLSKKRPDLDITHELHNVESVDEIEICQILGMPQVNEYLFFHHKSQTLILTDLCFYQKEATGLTGFYFWLNNVKNQMNSPKLVLWSIKNKADFLSSLEQTRSYSIRQISMCHNLVLTESADREWTRVLDGFGVN